MITNDRRKMIKEFSLEDIGLGVEPRRFYQPCATMSSFTFQEGAQMVKHFAPKVIDGKIFIVWRKKPELGEGSPIKKVHEYSSYLKASLKAYMGNCKIANAEAEFAGAR